MSAGKEPPPPVSVVALGRDESTLFGDIIADGFSDDPICNWVFGGPEAIRPFFTLLARETYLPRGSGHRTDDSSGVALWVPPGVSNQVGRWTGIKSLLLGIRHGGLTTLRRGAKVDAQLGPRKPKGDYYYLFAIAVRRGARGHGIGHELMLPTMRRIDAEGAAAYVESSSEKNLTFYQRFGFEVTGEIELEPGGPRMWTLWREGARPDRSLN